MELRIAPEPGDEERLAIEEALERRRADEAAAAAGSAWWRAGLAAALREDRADDE
jgi:hypothetical protein